MVRGACRRVRGGAESVQRGERRGSLAGRRRRAGRRRHALVLLQQLEQVYAERLEDQAEVRLVFKVLMELYHERARIGTRLGGATGGAGGGGDGLGGVAVGEAQPLQDLDLRQRLPAERLPIANDLDGQDGAVRGACLEDLSKGPCERSARVVVGSACGVGARVRVRAERDRPRAAPP